METSTSKRTGVLLGATILAVVIGVSLFRRRVDAAASPLPRAPATAEAASAAPAPVAASSSAAARRARDAMRAQILEALHRRASAASASPAAPAPAAPRAPAAAPAGDEPRGTYEPSYIQQVVREDMFPLLKQCYEGALTRRPTLRGKLVVSFEIVGDPDVGGIVENAAFADGSDLQDPEMETCVRETMMTLTFDKPPTGGGRVSVKYPIAFAPGDEDAPADAGKG